MNKVRLTVTLEMDSDIAAALMRMIGTATHDDFKRFKVSDREMEKLMEIHEQLEGVRAR